MSHAPFVLTETQHVILHLLLSYMLPTTINYEDGHIMKINCFYGGESITVIFCGVQDVKVKYNHVTELVIFQGLEAFKKDFLYPLDEFCGISQTK